MTDPATREFTALRPKESEARKQLESFATPKGVSEVSMFSDEVTSLCPLTNQPDFETIQIVYEPDELCLESKSLKLYFQSLRNEGAFIEDLSSSIAHDVAEALQPFKVSVHATQKPRGGIGIRSTTLLIRVDTPDGREWVTPRQGAELVGAIIDSLDEEEKNGQ